MVTCPDCGCRVYKLGCVNCNEAAYIQAQGEYEHICDGCAQLVSECLCGVDPAEAADCRSGYHPGCRNCEVK